MVYRGTVKNGIVVFEKGTELPEGTEVRIEPCLLEEGTPTESPTLAEQFADVIGAVPELPSDMAENHNHYLHGAPTEALLK